MINIKGVLTAGVLAASLSAGVAGAQTVTLPNGTTMNGPMGQNRGASSHHGMRGEKGSARNIGHVRHRLERLIDNLSQDQRDYGGHRVQALQLLQQARAQLLAAEQYDQQHPGQ